MLIIEFSCEELKDGPTEVVREEWVTLSVIVYLDIK